MGAWEARSALPKMKKEVKVSIATLKRGLRNESLFGKIGAFLVAKGGGGVSCAPFG